MDGPVEFDYISTPKMEQAIKELEKKANEGWEILSVNIALMRTKD